MSRLAGLGTALLLVLALTSLAHAAPPPATVPTLEAWHLVPLPPTAVGQRVLLRIQGTGPAIGVLRDARVGARHELLSSVTRTGLPGEGRLRWFRSGAAVVSVPASRAIRSPG